MYSDTEIGKKIWDGKIAIQFNLAESEKVSQEAPLPFYLLAPRGSYIRLITESVRRYFQDYAHDVTDIGDEMWFSYDDTPLKWHYPIGVLHDLLAYQVPMPWKITVHFSCFPDTEVLSCKSDVVDKVVESHVISMIKQSDCIKHGSSKKAQALLKKDYQALWNSFKKQAYEDSYDQYWAVNRRLICREEGEDVRSIPYRFYEKDLPVFMKPFSPYREDTREPKTLREFIEETKPNLLVGGELPEGTKILIQGVEPSLETPVQWLSDICSHPDNFLHIVLHRDEDPQMM